MSDESPAAANTHVNGTAPHAQLPNAPSWFAAMLANPAQSFALLGVLLLGGAEGAELIRGRDPVDVDAEIARRAASDEQAALVRQAAADAKACIAAVSDLKTDAEKSAEDARERTDELFAFTGEIAQYLPKLTKTPPETGPRYDEYVRKALMRGLRGHEDR